MGNEGQVGGSKEGRNLRRTEQTEQGGEGRSTERGRRVEGETEGRAGERVEWEGEEGMEGRRVKR